MRAFNDRMSDTSRGRTQMRVAAVDTKEKMLLAPELCARLFEQYKRKNNTGKINNNV